MITFSSFVPIPHSLCNSPLDGDGERDVERGGEGDVHEREDPLRPQVHVHRRRPRDHAETLQFDLGFS